MSAAVSDSSLVELRPDVDAEDIALLQAVAREVQAVAERSLGEIATDVSPAQFRLLSVLHEHGCSTCGQVARSLGLVASSVTRLGDRLHASGHVRRGADASNRSVVTLALTPLGRQVVEQVNLRRQAELATALSGLSLRERGACLDGLRHVHTELVARS